MLPGRPAKWERERWVVGGKVVSRAVAMEALGRGEAAARAPELRGGGGCVSTERLPAKPTSSAPPPEEALQSGGGEGVPEPQPAGGAPPPATQANGNGQAAVKSPEEGPAGGNNVLPAPPPSDKPAQGDSAQVPLGTELGPAPNRSTDSANGEFRAAPVVAAAGGDVAPAPRVGARQLGMAPIEETEVSTGTPTTPTEQPQTRGGRRRQSVESVRAQFASSRSGGMPAQGLRELGHSLMNLLPQDILMEEGWKNAPKPSGECRLRVSVEFVWDGKVHTRNVSRQGPRATTTVEQTRAWLGEAVAQLHECVNDAHAGRGGRADAPAPAGDEEEDEEELERRFIFPLLPQSFGYLDLLLANGSTWVLPQPGSFKGGVDDRMERSDMDEVLKSHDEYSDKVLTIIYAVLDPDNVGHISLSELMALLVRFREWNRFYHWAKGLNFPQVMVSRLLHKDKHNPNSRLSVVAPDKLKEKLFGFEWELEQLLQKSIASLHEHENKASTQEKKKKYGNAKYGGGDNTFQAVYGDRSEYMMGLDGLIGIPAEKILDAMQAEHSSTEQFSTGNYCLSTSPSDEFEFVLDPVPGKAYEGLEEGDLVGRKPLRLEEFMAKDEYKEANLTKEELIALRLYTGPLYALYNPRLRRALNRLVTARTEAEEAKRLEKEGKPPADKKPQQDKDEGGFTTTIHMIASGIIKLSAITKVPPNRKVYRGLSGVRLPKQFWKKNQYGVKGGVEGSFLSTTTNINVALQYSEGGQMPIVFALDVGQVDRGAALRWLSQYPGEDEILWPPLCNLEAVGTPKICVTDEDTPVLVINMRININIKSLTKEELEERRRNLLVASMGHTIQEIDRDVTRMMLEPPISEFRRTDPKGFIEAGKCKDILIHECNTLKEKHKQTDANVYNIDSRYREAIHEASLLKDLAISKYDFWLETPRIRHTTFGRMTMWQIGRMRKREVRRLWDRYFEIYEKYPDKAGVSEADREVIKGLALQIAVKEGFILDERNVDERRGMDGDTALIAAAAEDQRDHVKLLLDAQCDIECNNSRGYTPLASAVCSGHTKTVELLLAHGAALHPVISPCIDYSVLYMACELGFPEIVEVLCDCERGGRGLFMAHRQGKINMNVCCLNVACSNGHRDIVTALSQRAGKDLVMVRDFNKWSVAYPACLNGHFAIVEDLCTHDDWGEELLWSETKYGETLAHPAAEGGHAEILTFLYNKAGEKLLLTRSKADPEAYAPQEGGCCAYRACMRGQKEILELLYGWIGEEELTAELMAEGHPCCIAAAEKGGHANVVDFLTGRGVTKK